jgi:tRNA(fMet)-specific endonuclease VapC
MILLDTDHFSVVADRRHVKHHALLGRLTSAEDDLALPVVSVEEQLRGWLAQIRRQKDVRKQIPAYQRLAKLVSTLNDWHVVAWDDSAADQFFELRRARIRIGTQDLKIASIALARDALLLSANLRDFQQVPALQVEDWLR